MRHKNARHEPLIEPARAVLVDTWDPLDIGSNRMLRDEYDAYLGVVVRMLKDPSTTGATLSSYLAHVEDHELGVQGDPEKRSLAVQALLELVRHP